jgi:OmcA/MtrC family decaheme c-type cytochrome
VLYGFGDGANDYSDIAYPQDIRYCTKCHDSADASTPEADQWRSKPSREACGACHDQVNFDTGENHDRVGPQTDNSAWSLCHPATGPGFGQSVEEAHTIPAVAAARRFEFNLIRVTDTAPGAFPVVAFSVTDPTQSNAAYDILNDPEFTAGGGVSRLAVLLGWETSDYTNTGSGSEPATPISINALTSAVANGDGTFSVTSPVPLPATVTGSGIAAIEGHPAVDPDGDGTFDVRVPVRNVFQYFAITDTAAVARREIVDLGKCNQCHASLSLHGNNRTDAIEVCVICHNPSNTDIAFRTSGAEVSIDFKSMIHAIHAADMRQNPLSIIGFGSSVNDFSEIRFPGDLQNCLTCHLEGTFELPLSAAVLATTVDSDGMAGDPPLSDGDPSNDHNITATTSACSACHDSDLAMAHMAQNGGAFEALQSEVDDGTLTETCALCHGPGQLADVRGEHQIE